MRVHTQSYLDNLARVLSRTCVATIAARLAGVSFPVEEPSFMFRVLGASEGDGFHLPHKVLRV